MLNNYIIKYMKMVNKINNNHYIIYIKYVIISKNAYK